MDKITEGSETVHDFMNVETFSQLPFIRPTATTPVKEKGVGTVTSAGAIRLFGKEFGSASPTASESVDTDTPCDYTKPNNNNNNSSSSSNTNNNNNSENGDSNRRFECHYCCRNFPTSQALGGHQNAHKRERQHAKRAQYNSLSTNPQVYELMNNNYTLKYNYPWNSNSVTNNYTNSSNIRFYGRSQYGSSYSHAPLATTSEPINGNPLGLWRIPTTVQNIPTFNLDRSMNQHNNKPLLAGFEETKASQVGGSSQSTSVPEHVSLDLHL